MTVLADRTVLPPSDPLDQGRVAMLAALVEHSAEDAVLVGPGGEQVQLPHQVYEVLVQVVEAMAAGRAITIVPSAQRLTTQEAADLLGISRPTLVRLLEEGEIPFEQPGRHRRIRLEDVLDYQRRRRSERRELLNEMIRRTEDLGLYEDEDLPT
ncbi:helix-turn-helix domain-containing protein [Planomonospora sp. ID82291]|uniref:helix-turn-helix domain-containing protein n=1 Tax=Planomonospora sp. ID82291 TaxID=2738136 RepID=UPI0018C3FF5F|nr:helix-turn-helix domain-containing protein [Planomonospora sp. ID82291]MBG0815489.1 helix-turn-helix domain-containing protein [Planomonospora sp. ID82291]